jgi:hypothetical protein
MEQIIVSDLLLSCHNGDCESHCLLVCDAMLHPFHWHLCTKLQYVIFVVVVPCISINIKVFCDQQMHTPHSTGYTHSLYHDTDNILTLYFNGKILKRVTLVRTDRLCGLVVRVKRQWQQCWYHLLIQMFSLKMFFHMCKHPVITWGEIWKVECANTSQPQHCTSQWRWGVALSWCKITPCTAVLVVYGKEPALP